MNSEAGRIATALAAELSDSSLRFFERPEVRGRLAIGTEAHPTRVTAECRFQVGDQWRDLPPRLWCDEKWIRRLPCGQAVDWHIFPSGDLCYVLRPQWWETLAGIESEHGTDAAIVSAVQYALNSSRYLLFRHLLGYRRKLAGWPADWPQYPHRIEDARRLYERTKRKGTL